MFDKLPIKGYTPRPARHRSELSPSKLLDTARSAMQLPARSHLRSHLVLHSFAHSQPACPHGARLVGCVRHTHACHRRDVSSSFQDSESFRDLDLGPAWRAVVRWGSSTAIPSGGRKPDKTFTREKRARASCQRRALGV